MKPNKFDDIRNIPFNPSKETYQTPEIDVLSTLSFNESTKWTEPTTPQKLIEYGKIPPFNIKALHQKGLHGLGVNVAIIDQPLALGHPEYSDQIAEYKVFMPEGYQHNISSMHGPAVTSLLVGQTIGTAPKAKLYYAATPTWLKDAQYEAKALQWIMNLNENLPDDQKIKFVSVSAAPGDSEMRSKNSQLWLQTVKEAEKSGICVVECTKGNRFISSGFIDYETKQFKYGFPKMLRNGAEIGAVHVPNSLRTVAESYDNQHFSYTFDGNAGLSWGIPYAVGLLCIGQQINPTLTASKLKSLLIETAAYNKCIVNPKDFIEAVKSTKTNEKTCPTLIL